MNTGKCVTGEYIYHILQVYIDLHLESRVNKIHIKIIIKIKEISVDDKGTYTN